MTSQRELAARFHALHVAGNPLTLANVWDPASARIVAAAGADAIATTSAGIAWGLGAADGNRLDRELMLEQLARIVAAGIPLYLNARIDVFLRQVGEESDRLAATLDRARAYLDAGASGIFVLGVGDPETIAALAGAVDAPVNVTGRPRSSASSASPGSAWARASPRPPTRWSTGPRGNCSAPGRTSRCARRWTTR
jgi:2-methylisocitrate lyase-like PEP mutase family enzyme